MRMMAVALAAMFASCAYRGSAVSVRPEELTTDNGWIAVTSVPLVQQRSEIDCGAAALAMVLGYWRLPITAEEVSAAYPDLTESGNMRAVDLRAYAQSKGLAAFLFRGDVEVLEHELGQKRPVIVGLIKKYGADLVAHYEVVVGYHPAKRLVLTLDPARGWQQNTLAGFLAEWEPSEKLTLVVIPQQQ